MHGSVANYPLLRRGTMGSSVGEGATWHGRVQPREVWASWLGSGPVMYTASVGMAPSLCGGVSVAVGGV